VLGLGCGWGHPGVMDAQIRWVTRGHNALIVALRASALRRSFSSLTTDVDSGTTCGFAAFMSAAGISHTFVSKRMSVHCIFATRVRSARDALRFSPEVQHRRSGRKAEPRRDRGAQPVDRCDVRDEQLAESVVTQDGCVLGVDEGAQDYAASLSRARRRSIQNSTMPATTDAPGRAATASR